jgi:hypothetical protein
MYPAHIITQKRHDILKELLQEVLIVSELSYLPVSSHLTSHTREIPNDYIKHFKYFSGKLAFKLVAST